MTATTEPTTETATSSEQPTGISGPPQPQRLSRRALLRWAGLGGVAALLANAAAASASPIYARRYANRVYPGVTVAGVALDGLSRDDATVRLAAAGQRYAAQPLRVVGAQGGQSWNIAPGELGVRFDYAAAIDRALAAHRGASRWDRFTGGFAALLPFNRARDLPLPVAIDEALLLQRLRAWADTATTPPTDATFTTADGQLAIAPDRNGLGIAFDPTRDALLDHAAHLATGPVALAMEPVIAPVTAARLRELLPQAQAVTAQPLALDYQGRRWSLGTDKLRAAVGYRRDGAQLALTVDTAAFRPTLQEAARAVATPPTNARIVRGNDGRFSIESAQAGALLDETMTLSGIERVLLESIAGVVTVVPLVMRAQAPAIAAADLEPAFRRLDAILNTPLAVAFQEYKLTLGRGDILPLLVLEEMPASVEKLRIAVDQGKALALARVVAAGIDRQPRDAQFKWFDGVVRETLPAEDGRTVQVEPTAQALAAAILAASGTALPTVVAVKPKVDSSALASVVLRDRLAYGDTDYSFSIPTRRHNVELSMGRLNGALIPPDGIFSFNQTVGEQTVANGYQVAYGIAMVGGTGPGTGQVQTVSSIGGGICQVSTTLFQAVYHAGLPVEERNWHLYWINGYGLPPSGLKGLDATVDDQSALDFKFRNTTGNWLAVEARAEGGRVKIALHGQNPGWQVQIDPPTIANERKADPAPVTEKTHDLPPGQKRQVESAVDGFDAANHTVVRDGAGNVLRDVTFRSSYLPSRNVTQVGVPASEPLT